LEEESSISSRKVDMNRLVIEPEPKGESSKGTIMVERVWRRSANPSMAYDRYGRLLYVGYTNEEIEKMGRLG
jgi:hypothetical protein